MSFAKIGLFIIIISSHTFAVLLFFPLPSGTVGIGVLALIPDHQVPEALLPCGVGF